MATLQRRKSGCWELQYKDEHQRKQTITLRCCCWTKEECVKGYCFYCLTYGCKHQNYAELNSKHLEKGCRNPLCLRQMTNDYGC